MNWGNKLLITFLVFGAGISFLVYRSMHTEFELVEKDYYKNELRYQDVIDGVNRANALVGVVRLQQSESGIELQLPEEMKDRAISGTVLFYCAYDSRLDRKFALGTAPDALHFFEKGKIAPGNYTVKIDWKADGKNYHTEKTMTVI